MLVIQSHQGRGMVTVLQGFQAVMQPWAPKAVQLTLGPISNIATAQHLGSTKGLKANLQSPTEQAMLSLLGDGIAQNWPF